MLKLPQATGLRQLGLPFVDLPAVYNNYKYIMNCYPMCFMRNTIVKSNSQENFYKHRQLYSPLLNWKKFLPSRLFP